MRRKREIPRRAARLGMTKCEFFRNLFSLSLFFGLDANLTVCGGCGKTQNSVIPRSPARREISLFPRFKRPLTLSLRRHISFRQLGALSEEILLHLFFHDFL